MKRDIALLDYIRFMCATLVMVSHLMSATGPEFTWLEHLGAPAVFIFFVISGFIIPYSSIGRQSSAFLTSRVTRLVPGVWICATLSLAALTLAPDAYGLDSLSGRYLRSIFLFPFSVTPVQNLSQIWVSSVYWTLFVEISFYAVIGLLIYLRQSSKIGTLATVLGAVSLSFWLVWLVVYYFLFDTAIARFYLPLEFKRYLDFTLVTHGAFFGLGINIWLTTFKQQGNRNVSTVICLLGGVLDAWHSGNLDNVFAIMNVSIVMLGVGAIWFAVRIDPEMGPFRSVSRLLGLTTYPLYLIHVPLGGVVSRVAISQNMSPMSACLMAMIACVLTALLIAKYLEPRLQAYVKNMLSSFSITQNRQRNLALENLAQ